MICFLSTFFTLLKTKTDIRINKVGISIKKMTFVLFSPDFITLNFVAKTIIYKRLKYR